VSGGDEPDATPAVLAAVERGHRSPCAVCGRSICGHDVVMSFVLGFKGSTRCLACLAFGLGRAAAEVRDNLLQHIHHRECWTAGWRRANELEKLVRESRSCPRLANAGAAEPAPAAPADGSAAPAGRPDAAWDAGDMSCGDLVLELRLRLRAMQPGQVLRLTSRDPGAPADLPAWCGLTGHTLLEASHPEYLIRRKAD
jgi:tRNA 2-thiouridine synthesizing protein A